MQSLVQDLLSLVLVVIGIVSGWAVLSPSVRDGVICKLGLISMSIGATVGGLAALRGARLAEGAAQLLLGGGAVVVVIGLAAQLLRHLRRHPVISADLPPRAVAESEIATQPPPLPPRRGANRHPEVH